MAELHAAARSGNPGWVQTCIGRGDSVDEISDNGFTPLQVVCIGGASDSAVACAGLLLDAGALPNKLGRLGTSCLQFACETGNIALVGLLLDRGADPNLVAGDLSPLMYALSCGEAEAASLLLDRGADVHYEFSNRSARDYAYRFGLLELAHRIELLQGAGASGRGDDA